MDYLAIALSALLWGVVWLLVAFGALLVSLYLFDVLREAYRAIRKD